MQVKFAYENIGPSGWWIMPKVASQMLAILGLHARIPQGLTRHEIAIRLDIPENGAHVLIHPLREGGFLDLSHGERQFLGL